MINKATLGKEVDGVIEYIYPKTSADMVEYTAEMTVEQKIQSIDTDITATNSRISNIVAQAGSDNTEIVDARTPVFTPADSSILDSNGACATLKDRLSADFSSLSNEIQNEINNIANTINSNYSELNENMYTLVNNLIGDTDIAIGEIEIGELSSGFINRGSISASLSNDRVSDFIQVIPGTYYLYTGYVNDARCGVAEYSDMDIATCVKYYEAGMKNSYTQKLFKTTENTNYIRVSSTNNTNIKLVQLYKETIFTICDQLYELSNSTLTADQKSEIIDLLNSAVRMTEIDLSSANWISDGYYDKNGSIASYKGSYYTDDYINIKSDCLYKLHVGFSDARSICFYDSDKNFLLGYPGSYFGLTYNYIPWIMLYTPSNAAYIRLSTQTMTLTQMYELDLGYGELFDRINDIINGKFDSTMLEIDEKIQFKPESVIDLIPYLNSDGTNVFINKSGTVQNGYGGDRATDFIEILPNTMYTYNGKITDARALALYDENKTKIFSISASDINISLGISPTSTPILQYKFTTPSNAKYARFSVYGISSATLVEDEVSIKEELQYILDNFNKLVNDAIIKSDETDYEVFMPDKIYAIDNDCISFYGRDYVQSIYPEGVIKDNLSIKINNDKRMLLQTNANNASGTIVSHNSFTANLSGDGLKSKKFSVDLIKTRASVAKNKTIIHLAIGDSITANQIPNTDGVKRGGVCYHSVMHQLSLMYQKDFNDETIKFIPIGTSNNFTNDLYEYKGTPLVVSNFGEGRGSWTIANYLRHATSITGKGNSSTSGQIQGEASWDILGLRTRQPIDNDYNESADIIEAWIGNDAQYDLIRNTPIGKYHWDYSEKLWNWAKLRNSSLSGSYTASSGQKAAIDTVVNALLDRPANPFYDRNVAKSNDYAFSITTYLNRYRTLEDDGLTRLVVGESAGNFVTDVNAYDVCTPTHISIELGENERWWYSGNTDMAASDILLMMSIINNELPNAYVGFFTTRMNGVRNQYEWNDYAVVKPFGWSSNVFKYLLNKKVAESVDNIKNFCVPCFCTHTPLTVQNARKDIDLATGNEIIVTGNDLNHPGIQGYWSIAYQLLAWEYYTLTL